MLLIMAKRLSSLVRAAVLALLWCPLLATAAPAQVTLHAGLAKEIAALPAISGLPVEEEALRGQPVAVSFFASWCPPCRTEFKHLNHLAKKFGQAGLTIVAINVFEAFDENDGPRMANFLDDTDPQFPVVTGTESIIEQFGKVQRIPTVFVFGRDGEPVFHFIHKVGARKRNPSEDELDRAVRSVLER